MTLRAFAIISLTLCLCTVFLGQSPDELNRGPVQAELLKHLNVRHLASGDIVFARVTADWNGADCVLRQGAILQARVETVNLRKARTESKLALSFTRAQCNGTEMVPLNLVLAAVADTPVDWRTVQDSQFRMPASFSNPHGGGMLAGFGSAAPGDLYSTHLEMMGILHRFPMGPKVKPGDVLGQRGMKLAVGAGPNRSSVLSAKNRDVVLGAYTQLLLVPESLAFAPSKLELTGGAHVPVADAAAPPARVEMPPNDLEVCAPPGCVVDLPVTPTELEGHSAGSFAAGPLGYAPRSHKILGGFDDEQVLAWLGPDVLLFAFNQHSLIRRSGAHSAIKRVVRAVLLDARNHKIVRAVDWEIGDTQRFLWQLDGRILVHVGNELRVYGAGLEVERSIPLSGPLSFVRIAPNGEVIVIGTLQERHTQELHAKLREDLANEPEEDVSVTILEKDFHTVASFMTISGLLPPTLLNEGQVKLFAQPKLGYRLAISTWTNATTTLARFDSLCTPQLSSVAPDFLFLLSCDAQNGDTEYRVLGPDGKLVLFGKSNLHRTGFEAAGTGQVFALKMVHALREMTPGADFTGSDLDSEEVRVYRASDGKRLLGVRVKEPATSHGSYALSPGGSQLAVLSGSEIKLFAVPAE